MDGLRQYIISVVTAALICGLLSVNLPDRAGKELVRLLCGLFLTLTVIRPMADIDVSEFAEYVQPSLTGAENAANSGEIMAREAMADIIKTETEAYILDKAAGMNAAITADITIGDNNIPAKATLSGKVSPYTKARLEDILESDLGITKENQVWTG